MNEQQPTETTLWPQVAILISAPAVALIGHGYHPWVGNPRDAEFVDRIAAAIAADPTRWAVSHLMVAIGSGLLILAFLAVRSYLREAGEDRWSAWGLPFIVFGSVLYALLPAMEFAPLAAFEAGGDAAATQAALQSWFFPILITAAGIFAIGVFGFATGIIRSGVFGSAVGWLIVGALIVMAATRFMPVGVAQLHIGPAAALLALWPIAYVMCSQPHAEAAPEPRTVRAA